MWSEIRGCGLIYGEERVCLHCAVLRVAPSTHVAESKAQRCVRFCLAGPCNSAWAYLSDHHCHPHDHHHPRRRLRPSETHTSALATGSIATGNEERGGGVCVRVHLCRSEAHPPTVCSEEQLITGWTPPAEAYVMIVGKMGYWQLSAVCVAAHGYHDDRDVIKVYYCHQRIVVQNAERSSGRHPHRYPSNTEHDLCVCQRDSQPSQRWKKCWTTEQICYHVGALRCKTFKQLFSAAGDL